LQSAQIVADKELERVTLNFFTALPAGSKAQVKIYYSAMLRGSMNGYYKSAWKRDGKTEYYALTHFQVGICNLLVAESMPFIQPL
jgi:aminopeptidase 2